MSGARLPPILAGLCAAAMLSGCAADTTLYAPRSSFSIGQDIRDFHDQVGTAASLKAYYAQLPETKQRRDQFITARLTLYNLEYLQFVSQFQLTKAQEDSIFDLTSTGVNLATVVTGSSAAKSILGAVATALTSTRTSLDKNFYNAETTSALISAMNAQRKAALVPILAGMNSDIGQYPLASAIVDLEAYQQAGTVQGALEAVQTDASAKSVQAQAQIDQYRSFAFQPNVDTLKLYGWIFPGFASFDHDTGAALDANGKPIAAVAANVAALRAWLAAHGLGGLELEAFLDNGKLATQRADAVSSLGIP